MSKPADNDQDRNALLESTKRRLKEAIEEVEDLSQKIETAADTSKEKMQEGLDEVRAMVVGLENKVRTLGETTDEKWQVVKDDLDYTWKAFRHSVNYFRSHFK